MYTIESFQKEFRLSSEISRPRWVGYIDSRSGFGNIYNGWYTEIDELDSISNMVDGNLYQMTKIVYTGETCDIGIFRGSDQIFKIDLAGGQMYSHDISLDNIIDICVDKNDSDYIFVATGHGIVDGTDAGTVMYRIDISGAYDTVPIIDTTYEVVFATDEQPFYHVENVVAIEVANIIDVYEGATHYIYVSLRATNEDSELWFQPWLNTDDTDTCRFLFRGEISGTTITLNDNTPPMATIKVTDGGLSSTYRRITRTMSGTTLSLNIGTSGDNVTYTDTEDPYHISKTGYYGFLRENSGETDTRFNIQQNALTEIDGIVVIGLEFASGCVLSGIEVTGTYGSAWVSYSITTVCMADRKFVYCVSKDNNISTLLETQEIFGEGGSSETVGITGGSLLQKNFNAFGNYFFYQTDYLNGERTLIKTAELNTTLVQPMYSYQPSNTLNIDGLDIIYDVSACSSISSHSLILHRTGGQLAIGASTETGSMVTPAWIEADLGGSFTIINGAAENFDNTINYNYKFSCLYDGYQEGPLSDVGLSPNGLATWTGTITTVSYLLKMANLPSKRVSHINLYRSDNDAYYRLLKSVPIGDFNESGDFYEYTHLDDGTSLASFEAINGYSQELENVSVDYSISTQFNGYLYVSGVKKKDDKFTSNYVFRSKQGRFSIFDWTNDFVAIDFAIDTISSFNGDIIVTNKDNIAIVDSEQMYVKKYINGIGCDNQDLVCKTKFGIVFVNDNDVFLWDGQKAQSISIPINQGDSSLDDVEITHINYDSVLKKILLFGVFNTNDINYFSYSFLNKRWDMGSPISTTSVPSVYGTFKDHNGKVYLSYNNGESSGYTNMIGDQYVDQNGDAYVD